MIMKNYSIDIFFRTFNQPHIINFSAEEVHGSEIQKKLIQGVKVLGSHECHPCWRQRSSVFRPLRSGGDGTAAAGNNML